MTLREALEAAAAGLTPAAVCFKNLEPIATTLEFGKAYGPLIVARQTLLHKGVDVVIGQRLSVIIHVPEMIDVTTFQDATCQYMTVSRRVRRTVRIVGFDPSQLGVLLEQEDPQ